MRAFRMDVSKRAMTPDPIFQRLLVVTCATLLPRPDSCCHFIAHFHLPTWYFSYLHQLSVIRISTNDSLPSTPQVKTSRYLGNRRSKRSEVISNVSRTLQFRHISHPRSFPLALTLVQPPEHWTPDIVASFSECIQYPYLTYRADHNLRSMCLSSPFPQN